MINDQKTRQIDQLTVHICANEQDLAQLAAKSAIAHLKTCLQEKPYATVILATGQSQQYFLEYFTASKEIDWKKIIFFHLDEYLGISADHPASFRYYLRQNVEKKLPDSQFYYIQGDTLEPLTECRHYSQLLRDYALDICFLGVGQNGHLAFNEPDVARFEDPDWVKLVKLNEITRLDQSQGENFATVKDVPLYSFTLTLPAIFSAQKLIGLAPHHRKAAIVQRLLSQSISETCPASFLRKHPQAELFLDQNSASFFYSDY